MQIDVIAYAGEINFQGYELICETLKQKKSERVLLVLATPGGDPHAAFRIARALQHTYGSFEALVPRYCKSAGTLIVIGATKLYMDDRSELGPLDVQVKKGDELFGRSSGLDIFQALSYLQTQAMAVYRNYLVDLTGGIGLSTRVGSEIASKLTIGLLEPIAAQIDPIKLAEMQRATDIAFEYGERLNECGENLLHRGLAKLVGGYPSHGFVIDRKEARAVFQNVEKPLGVYGKLSARIHNEIEEDTNSRVPGVNLFQVTLDEETSDETVVPDAAAAAASATAVNEAVNGACPPTGVGEASAQAD